MQKIIRNDRHVPCRLYRCIVVASIASLCIALAGVATAAESSTSNDNTSGPRNFEGIWWLLREPSRSPGSVPGLPPGGVERPVELTGTSLQCAPIQRLTAGGGGETALVVQNDKQLLMISEEGMELSRRIYIGGTHPPANRLVPQPNGHSIGHWEGNTLVVDSIGYSDREGHDSGEHIVERISKQGNELHSEASITDKSGQTRTQTIKWQWRPDLQFNENICEEGFMRYEVIDGKLDNPNIPPNRETP